MERLECAVSQLHDRSSNGIEYDKTRLYLDSGVLFFFYVAVGCVAICLRKTHKKQVKNHSVQGIVISIRRPCFVRIVPSESFLTHHRSQVTFAPAYHHGCKREERRHHAQHHRGGCRVSVPRITPQRRRPHSISQRQHDIVYRRKCQPHRRRFEFWQRLFRRRR